MCVSYATVCVCVYTSLSLLTFHSIHCSTHLSAGFPLLLCVCVCVCVCMCLGVCVILSKFPADVSLILKTISTVMAVIIIIMVL